MDKKITLEKRCPICGKMNEFHCLESEYQKWLDGELVQKCFPNATPDERELMITGICPECWDNMMFN
jgi:phage FluMu protein Com